MEQEIWKDVVGYEGLYKVSNWGNVISVRANKPMKQTVTAKKYLLVTLTTKGKGRGFVVHRLVAKAFIPNPDNKPQVNHIDGIKANNHATNLEWCTQTENMQHASKSGLARHKEVVKLTREWEYVDEFYSMVLAAASVPGGNSNSISDCCRNWRPTHRGFRWMKKSDYEIMLKNNGAKDAA